MAQTHEQQTKTEYVNNILQELDKCEDKENFLKAMKKYEDAFIGHYENQVHDNLQPELKRKENRPPSSAGQPVPPKFLQASSQEEREYLAQYNRFNRFHVEAREGETTKHLQKTFQQGAEVQFNQFVEPPKNFLDVEANTKYFYPSNNRPYMKEPNKPIQDFANTQNIYQNWQRPQGLSNPEIKDVYPRNQFNAVEDEVKFRHQFFSNQQKQPDKSLLENIHKLGGIEDCLSVMEPSLRLNEVSAFQDAQRSTGAYSQQPVPQQLFHPHPNPPQIAANQSQNAYRMQGLDPMLTAAKSGPQFMMRSPSQQLPQTPLPSMYAQPQTVSIPQPFSQQPLFAPPSEIALDPFSQTAPARSNVVVNNKFPSDPFQKFEEQRNQQQFHAPQYTRPAQVDYSYQNQMYM